MRGAPATAASSPNSVSASATEGCFGKQASNALTTPSKFV